MSLHTPAIHHQPITPQNDPWEAYEDLQLFGQSTLTNIEFTTTTLCNMRCEHCAVGICSSVKTLKHYRLNCSKKD